MWEYWVEKFTRTRCIEIVDELNIQQLISHVQEYLINHQAEFLHQNPTGILETVYQHETFTDLWNFCLEKICENPKVLFNSDSFLNLKAPLLELLLKRDDLNMEEIEILEFIEMVFCSTKYEKWSNKMEWRRYYKDWEVITQIYSIN